jgi:hypothetical protein
MTKALPPEMMEYFSAYMNPADLLDAQLVTTSDTREHTAPAKLDVWVSYIPRLRCFSAHREALGEIRASSLSELCTKIAEAQPGVEIALHLSKVAKAEVAARRRGVPQAVGWT